MKLFFEFLGDAVGLAAIIGALWLALVAAHVFGG